MIPLKFVIYKYTMGIEHKLLLCTVVLNINAVKLYT